MLFIVTVILIVISLGIYIGYVADQGNKDERGQAILARSSQVAFVFVLIGFVFQGLYFQFANPTVDQIQTMIYIWMTFICCSNSVSILVLNKIM